MIAVPTARRRIAKGLCTLACLALSSCFTMGLWGFSPETETDQFSGKDETVYAYDSSTEWSWSLLFLRILLTPATFVLDCATAPIQAFFWGSDD